jgi:hypothetical protein
MLGIREQSFSDGLHEAEDARHDRSVGRFGPISKPTSPSNSQPDQAGDPWGVETISFVTGFVPVEW